MLSIIVLTHGNLAKEFVSVMKHVVGNADHTHAIGIFPEDDMEEKRQELVDLVKAQPDDVPAFQGTVVVTDMFGGTPSNLALSLLDEPNVEVIAGVNIPMLVKLASSRARLSLNDAAQEAQDAGKRYMNVARHFLEKTA